MKANQARGDEAVSPVIAVILMVAITVVLAATVYIWVTSFSSQQDAGVQATVVVDTLDSDGDVQSDTIRLLLSNTAESFAAAQVTVTNNGAPATLYTDQGTSAAFSTAWTSGTSLFLNCTQGNNEIIVTLRNSVVASRTVRCDEATP
ncbi:MAG TPA: type IV pilin N-terminal domain-containing protein [Candidatus Thermoplasmatota archaeon]|nr:type IV pilin N-terminal domain-containing protein [Candidatus Thermoplasmatota archaeon]